MRTETDEIRDNLKYLTLLARDYPSQAAAASEIISTQALLKLPKGTEHFMSDLHGENEAFVHILNSASGKRWMPCWVTPCRKQPVPSLPP